MAEGIDAKVDKVQPAVARPALDGSGSKAERAKLPIRDDPMLPLGKLGNGSIEGGPERTWAAFGLTMRPDAAHVRHGRMVGRKTARVALGLLRKCGAGLLGVARWGAARPPSGPAAPAW